MQLLVTIINTRNNNTAVSSLVDVTCIDGPIVEVALYRTDNTTTRGDNIRNNTNAISSLDVSWTDNTSPRDDNTCLDVARNNNTAFGIVNVTCIAFDAVPIIEAASYSVSCNVARNDTTTVCIVDVTFLVDDTCIDVTCTDNTVVDNHNACDNKTRNDNTAVSTRLVDNTCIDVSRTANTCTRHNDSTTTRDDNIRNSNTDIGSIVINVTCPVVEVASYTPP